MANPDYRRFGKFSLAYIVMDLSKGDAYHVADESILVDLFAIESIEYKDGNYEYFGCEIRLRGGNSYRLFSSAFDVVKCIESAGKSFDCSDINPLICF